MRNDKRVWVMVKNAPHYVTSHDYIVARAVNGELWFYGAYPTKEKAEEVLEDFVKMGNDNGIIIH